MFFSFRAEAQFAIILYTELSFNVGSTVKNERYVFRPFFFFLSFFLLSCTFVFSLRLVLRYLPNFTVRNNVWQCTEAPLWSTVLQAMREYEGTVKGRCLGLCHAGVLVCEVGLLLPRLNTQVKKSFVLAYLINFLAHVFV